MNDYRGATVNISLEEFDRLKEREEKSQKQLSDLRKQIRACTIVDTEEYLAELDRIDSDMPDATDEELDEAEKKAQSKIVVSIKVKELKTLIEEHCCNFRDNIDFEMKIQTIEEEKGGNMLKMGKREFVGFVGMVLAQTDEGVANCHIDDDDEGEVIIVFENGFVKRANIECDSHLAIIKDIIAAIER